METLAEPQSDQVLHFTTSPQVALLRELKNRYYQFITPTPATQARVLERQPVIAKDLRGVLGWSLPFEKDLLDAELLGLMLKAGAIIQQDDGRLRSRYRVASLMNDLYLHSAYPTDAEDAVFFGPDSYRFAQLIEREVGSSPTCARARLVDIGTGTGVGGIVAAKLCPGLDITMTDINEHALHLARTNCRAAGVEAHFTLGADLAATEGSLDIVLANPPYIVDPQQRDYRDGGDMHGGRVAYDMAASATPRLAAAGRLILYTGSAIVGGRDPLQHALRDLAARENCTIRYTEIDPDVFGEELSNPGYEDVERIAVVSAVLTREVDQPFTSTF